jgi:hypothetical protein
VRRDQAEKPAALVDGVDGVDAVDIAPWVTVSTVSTPSTQIGASSLGRERERERERERAGYQSSGTSPGLKGSP